MSGLTRPSTSNLTRFRCDHYPALGLYHGNTLYKFCDGALTTDQAGAAFIRSTDYYKRGMITELLPKAAPELVCPDCRASFADDADFQHHLRYDHGTALRNRRAELATLTGTALPPTKAAGGAPEPWCVCESCGRYYPPRQINQSSCSPRCRYRLYRARKRAAQETVRNGHPSQNGAPDHPEAVAWQRDALTSQTRAPAGPKRWELSAKIDPALGLAVRRIARIRRETVSVTVDRLLRVGVRRYKRTHGTEDFADLPELRSGAGRLHRARRRGGPIRLVEATPEEAEAVIATTALIGKAAANGNGGGEAL
jgi:hypothetical protein